MKKYKLDREEIQILKDVESGKYRSVKNLEEEKKRHQQYAKNTLNKLKNINIQTLAAAVLRQYIERKINITL